jgi:hypothetical protein
MCAPDVKRSYSRGLFRMHSISGFRKSVSLFLKENVELVYLNCLGRITVYGVLVHAPRRMESLTKSRLHKNAHRFLTLNPPKTSGDYASLSLVKSYSSPPLAMLFPSFVCRPATCLPRSDGRGWELSPLLCYDLHEKVKRVD